MPLRSEGGGQPRVQGAVSSEEPTPCLPRKLLALFRFAVCNRCERNLHPFFSVLALEFLNAGRVKADSSMGRLGRRLPDHHAPVFCQAHGSNVPAWQEFRRLKANQHPLGKVVC
jgi:hypothetical protein